MTANTHWPTDHWPTLTHHDPPNPPKKPWVCLTVIGLKSVFFLFAPRFTRLKFNHNSSCYNITKFSLSSCSFCKIIQTAPYWPQLIEHFPHDSRWLKITHDDLEWHNPIEESNEIQINSNQIPLRASLHIWWCHDMQALSRIKSRLYQSICAFCPSPKPFHCTLFNN